jgi:L-fucose dehydrogenase
MFGFRDRVVLVTGAAKGIGAGCARIFCEAGGSVVLFDRDTATGTVLAAELQQAGPGRAVFAAGDVTSTPDLARAVELAIQQFGRLDCIINNAGVHPPATRFGDTRPDDVESLFRVNFLGGYIATQLALPHLRQTRGTVIFMSSMTAVLGQDCSSAYAATKAAQLGLTKALAKELGPEGIRVNAILPSNIDTPLMRDWAATLPDPASALRRVADLQVFGRMGTPEEVGRVALFLASDDSSFVTGQGLEVDGGAALDY